MVISLNPMNIIFDTMIRIYNIKQSWGKHVKKWVELRRQIQNRKDEKANPREKLVQGSLCPVPACPRIFPALWQKFCSSSLLVNLLHFSAQSGSGRRGGDISSLGWRSSGRAWACLLSLSSRTPTDTSIGPCNRGLGATVTQGERVEDTTDRGSSLEEELSWGDLVSFTTTTPWTAFGEVNHPPRQLTTLNMHRHIVPEIALIVCKFKLMKVLGRLTLCQMQDGIKTSCMDLMA